MPLTSRRIQRDLQAKHRDKQKGTVRRLRGRSFAEHLTPIIGGSSTESSPFLLSRSSLASPGPTACPPPSFFPLRYVMRFPFPLLNTHQPPVIVLNFLQSYNYVGLRGVSHRCYILKSMFVFTLSCLVRKIFIGFDTIFFSRSVKSRKIITMSLSLFNEAEIQRSVRNKKIILPSRQYIDEAQRR